MEGRTGSFARNSNFTAAAAALFALAFCTGELLAKEPGGGFGQLAKEDVRTLLAVKKSAKPGIPLTLSLADPDQRRFLERQLRDAGLLAEKGYGKDLGRSFDRLAAAHQAAPPSQKLTLLQMEKEYGNWHPGALITQLNPTTRKNEYYAAATLAVRRSLHHILVLQLFDSGSWQPIGKAAVADEWLKSHHSLGAYGSSASGDVAAIFTYLYLEPGGEPVAQVLFKTIGKFVDPSFSGLQPCPASDPNGTACATGQVTSSLPNPGTTKICLNRGPNIDNGCDQTWEVVGGGTQEPPEVGFAGTVTGLTSNLLGNNAWMPAQQTSPNNQITNYLTSASGACQVCVNCQLCNGTDCSNSVAAGSTLLNLTFSSTDPSEFSWVNPPSGTAPTATGPFNQTASYCSCGSSVYGQVNFQLSFVIGLVGSATQTFTVSSGASCVPNTTTGATACVYPLTLVWGCLPAGTPIRMADGSLKNVEDVLVQEKVLADAGGRVLTVLDTLRGKEEEPLVAIADDRGHHLELTKTHPVITARGVVQADHLKVGDELFSEAGPAKVVTIERRASAQPVTVYNMNLGAPEGATEKAGEDQTTLFAGGILVGDNQMQGRWEEKARVAREDDVPAEFRADYLEWVKAMTSAKSPAKPPGRP